jgi:hypothetical protein
MARPPQSFFSRNLIFRLAPFSRRRVAPYDPSRGSPDPQGVGVLHGSRGQRPVFATGCLHNILTRIYRTTGPIVKKMWLGAGL